MRYRKGRVEDVDLAWEMAEAEDPVRRNIISARRAGATATHLSQLAAQANRAGRLTEQDYRARIRREAYDEIIKNSDTPVIDKGFFESFWGSGASRVWISLQKQVAQEPQIPLEFVHVVDDEFVLRGDLRMAAWGLSPAPSGKILERIVDYLGTDKGEPLLEAQSLPTGSFSPLASSAE